MVVHSYYDEDPRVRREAEALVEAGHAVDVFALRRADDDQTGDLHGVRIHRLDVQRHQGAGLGTYLREYVSFLARAAGSLAAAHRRRPYGLVQVHTPPDFLVAAGLPVRLRGVPLVLDLHEAMPEFFRSRFPRASHPLVHRALLLQERLSIALASAVVTVNPLMADRLVGLGVPRRKIDVVPNAPSLARFEPALHPRREFAEDGVIRLVYGGALTPIYELDVVIEAVALVRASRPELDLRFDAYGRGDREAALRDLATSLGLDDRVRFWGRIPIDDMPRAIAAADIGVAPTRRDPFTDVSLSTKIFEYGAMRKPVIASRLPMVEATFPAGTVARYEPGDPASLAAALIAVVDDRSGREASVAATRAVVEARSWERESGPYVALVERLART